MTTILFYPLSLVIILNFILGIVILSRSIKNKINILFGLLSLGVFIWSSSILGFYFIQLGHLNNIWILLSHFSASLIALVFLYFSLNFPVALIKNKLYNAFILLPFIISSYFLFFSKYIIGGVVNFTYKINQGYIFYSLYIALYFLLGYISLYIQHRKLADPIDKIRVEYILVGSILSSLLATITDLILPYFNIFQYTWLGPLFTFILVISIAVAILKYHLFNIKVLTAELLTFGIWIFLLVRTLLTTNWIDRLVDGGLFVLVVIFGILLIRSVLKEVQHAEELEKLTQKLEGLSKYKSELISIVAHQLKNPLAVVKGYSSLIGDGTIKDPAKIQEVYQKIKLSTNKLIDLLNNLLDLGHIEDGKMHYEFGDINLNSMLSEIVNDFQFAATSKKLVLELEPCAQDPVVSGDPYKLSQVFRNLVDNSIKYTEVGWVKVNITSGGGFITVKVYDSGRGVSEELLPKLFQRFQRGVEEKQILGSGLGLYISRQIVEDHHGKIWVESDGEGKGSRFFVKLPGVTPAGKQSL